MIHIMQASFAPHNKNAKWDLDVLALAQFWANRRSKDGSTKVGAVAVSPDRQTTVLGYNGLPHGIYDDHDLLNNPERRNEKYAKIIHAEINATINARQSVQGWTMYTSPFQPCGNCTKFLIQAGFRRIVAPLTPEPAADASEDEKTRYHRWKVDFRLSEDMLEEAGVDLTLFDMRF